MKKIILFLILSIYLQANIIVIGNSNCKTDSLSRIELKNLYLGINKISNKEKINIFDREEKDIYEEFVTQELNKSIVLLETYWVRMLFSGKVKPPKRLSKLSLNELDNINECAIIYIKENEFTKNFKRINIVE